jgi:hypothetical protein
LDTGDVVVVIADLLYCRVEFALTSAGDENVGTLVDEPLCRGKAMPLLPPVITATFPSSLFILFFYRW